MSVHLGLEPKAFNHNFLHSPDMHTEGFWLGCVRKLSVKIFEEKQASEPGLLCGLPLRQKEIDSKALVAVNVCLVTVYLCC